MRIQFKNVRTRSKVFSVSLPLELAQQVYDTAAGLSLTPSRYLAGIIADELGYKADKLRGPGNPDKHVPDKWDKMKEAMGDMAPSKRELRRMFPTTGPELYTEE